MRKGIKKSVSGILSGLLLLTLLQTGVTVQAETGDTGVQANSTPVPYTENTGDFTVTGGTYGTDYEYDENSDVLTIKTATELTITTNGNPTAGMIRGQGPAEFNIVLQDVYLNGTENDSHINFFGNLNLTISGTNKIDVTGYGLECVNLTITSVSTGSLVLAGTVMDLRLGGDYSRGNLTVNGGTLAYNKNKAEISGTTTVNAPGTIKQIAPAPSLSISDVERTKNSLTVQGTFDTDTYGNVEYQWDDGTWSASASLSGLTAGSGHSVAVRYKGNDQYWQSDASTTVSVSTLKDGSTLIAEPSELKGTYGQRLSDVSLPEGWSWENSSTALTVGASSYPAVFDTVKHEADDYDFTGVTGYDVTARQVKRDLSVSVGKGISAIAITTKDMDKEYDGKAAAIPVVTKTGSTENVVFTWYENTGTQDNPVWQELKGAPADAGNYKVAASVEADNNYLAASEEKEFTIAKARPSYILPSGLTLRQGSALSELTLPDGFSWTDGSQTAGAPGRYLFDAVFTPEDTKNYEAVTVQIPVTVQSAEGLNNKNNGAGNGQERNGGAGGTGGAQGEARERAPVQTGVDADILPWSIAGMLSLLTALVTMLIKRRKYR